MLLSITALNLMALIVTRMTLNINIEFYQAECQIYYRHAACLYAE